MNAKRRITQPVRVKQRTLVVEKKSWPVYHAKNPIQLAKYAFLIVKIHSVKDLVQTVVRCGLGQRCRGLVVLIIVILFTEDL